MKKTLSFIMLVMIIMTSIMVYAATTVTMSLTADKNTLTPGDEITLTFAINNITGIEGGIKAIQGTVEYDTNIFEQIQTSDKVDMNGWATELNTANNMFAGTTSGATSGGIFTLTLKVKEGVTATSTTVSIREIKTADPTNDDRAVDVADVSVTIGSTVITPTNNTTGNSTTGNNIVIGNTTGNGTTGTTNNKITIDNTTSSNQLPQTGISYYVVLAIAIVAIIAVVSIVRYKNIIK